MLHHFDEQGYILHTRPYRETSVLVDFFGKQYGKMPLVVKKNKHTIGLLQPFCSLAISVRGKGELKKADHLEAQGLNCILKEKYLFSGFYINELIAYLVERYQVIPGLFALYEQTLSGLMCHQNLEAILRRFEFTFLDSLGYGIDFNYDNSGENIAEDKRYVFLHEHGFKVTDSCQYGITGLDVINIGRFDFDQKSTLRVAKQLSRQVFHQLLDGREIKSRHMFRQHLGAQQ